VRASVILLSACAIVVASGCSNDEDKPVRSVTVPAGAPVEIEGDEYRFDPGRVVVKRSGARTQLRIVMANKGKLAHNLHLRDGDRNIAATPTFRPGEERSVSASLPAGSYSLVCTVADHEELGMVGKLEVR
jgi:plastocyanin